LLISSPFINIFVAGGLFPTVVFKKTLGMPIQTAQLQQSTTLKVVLTPANTVAHTRSSPQQPINEGAIGQPVIPQVDSAQLLQTLLNQLSISSQLNAQQSAPSASQPIGQAHQLQVIQTLNVLLKEGHHKLQIHSQEF
jgi:hypothetical protein